MSTKTYATQALKVIKESTFEIEPNIYVYAKVSSAPQNDHFMITRDGSEITVVTTLQQLSQLDIIERNKDDYRLIAMNVSVPFYSVGFLATVAEAFATSGMNILMVSTYSKDYVLLRSDLADQAREILLSLGFKQHKS